MPEFRFVDEWDEETNIDWWKAGRVKLNKIIRPYNQWQIEGFDQETGERLRAQILCGIQTFAQRDGGGEWLKELEGMLAFVESKLKET